MMDRLDATLEQFLFQEEYAPTPQQLQDVEDGLFALWRKMEASGVTHGDMHAGNVGLKALPDGRLKLFLLDFGRASTQVSNLPIDMSHFIYSLVSQSGGGATRKWALQLKKKMNAFLQRRGVRSIVGRPSEYDRLRKPYEDAYLVIEDD
jgi:Ser/Thr protein kinase RdoA (MazF antagonist)